MPAINRLLVRDESNPGSSSDPTMNYLLITLLIIVLLGFVLMGALYFLKKRRDSIKDVEEALPAYSEKPAQRGSHHRHSALMSSKHPEPIYVIHEKQDLLSNSSSPPQSPVPEIRITFPEEVDDAGKRQSGKVVVVRVGENGVGLEPVSEIPPPYQQDGRFQSLDLDRIGGLKEKESRYN
ncbi:MAG: hypothetical protein M1820_003526 [Bogoriella megaspora]|nr:MAG: hypothetical protein M1820_003526 [Bogoriella megaspora]